MTVTVSVDEPTFKVKSIAAFAYGQFDVAVYLGLKPIVSGFQAVMSW